VEDNGQIVEIAPHLAMQTGLVVLDREQVVAAPIEYGLRNLGLAAHGVGGDECAGEGEAFELERYGGELVGFGLVGLLAEHEPLAARPGRHHLE